MKTKLTAIILITGLAAFAVSVYAAAPARPADAPMEAAPEPKKKKAGEACKTSDDCQRHHACLPAENKNICTAVPHPPVPPT